MASTASKELSFIDYSGSSDSDSSTQSDVVSGPAPATKVVSLMDRLKAPKTSELSRKRKVLSNPPKRKKNPRIAVH